MTVKDKKKYVLDLLKAIINRDHGEELHEMFLEHVKKEDETEFKQEHKEFWDEKMKELELKIGMKIKGEKTEEEKNLLIEKLEAELKNMNYVMTEKDNLILELVNKILQKTHSEVLESYIEVENELDKAKKASSLWSKYLKTIESRIGMEIKQGIEAQNSTEEEKDLLIEKLEEDLKTLAG